MSTSRSDDSRFRAEISSGFPGLSKSQLEALCAHYRLLLAWNKRLNLTRVVSAADAAQVHYVESLFLGTCLPPGPLRVADVGSGAGFPGIPVAILRSECTIDLIESHQRKAVFLREAARDLSNTRVLSRRAEDVAPQYDWVVSRAIRPKDVLSFGLASNVALLISTGDAGSTQTFPIQGSNQRVVAIYRDVPRGTLPGHDKI